jgi:hypothetical protein
MIRCPNRATVRQQLTHAARLRAMQEHVVREVERDVCDSCADLIDKDWLTVETLDQRFDLSGRCLHGIPRKYCDSCFKVYDAQCEGMVEEENEEVRSS